METSKKIGRYEILEELGRGAMGTVYLAKDPAMGRVVALKTIISVVLASEQGSEFRERFFREARAAGGLAHPGIVTVFDVGEHEGSPFLVMEFVKGRTLADAVKQGERLTTDRVCEIGQKIAEALGYAHQHGVVHRDIDPANILLTSRETHGIERPKITDFGVAKLTEGQATMTGQILGTPAFMPPEQFTGAMIDGRADIFSLGVVLYWMATGEQPFPGESMTSVSYKVVHTDPVPPRKLNPSIPATLDALILKCLAKSPEDRYQTGDDLARDLGEVRKGSKATGLGTTSQEAVSGGDPNDTFVETVPVPRALPPVATPREVRTAAPAGKSNNRLILAGLAAAILVVGSWFALRHKDKPGVQETAASLPSPAASVMPSAPTPAPTPAPISAPSTVRGGKVTSPAVGSTLAKKQPPEAAPASQEMKPVPTAEPAEAEFNPKSLDPKENAKLKIEADKVPAGLDFTLEMNGKVYLQGSKENKTLFDGLYVPPGVQEFRVTVKSGDIQKTSNVVSAEFKAKKRYTLRIELRSQGMPPGSGVPQGLYPNSQLVVSLNEARGFLL